MKTRTARLLRAFIGGIGLLLLAGFFVLGAYLYGPITESNLSVEWFIFFSLAAVFGVVLSGFLHPLFHEAGHMLFGAIAGMRLISFRVWFLEAEREGTGWKFRFAKAGGGRTAMLPKSPDRIRGKTVVYALGGLLGTTAYLLLSCVVIRFAPTLPFWVYALFGVGAVTAFTQLLSNLIPSEGDEQTDGERILSLLKNSPSSKVMLAVLCAEGELLSGKRPREINPDFLFNVPVVAEDDFHFIALLSVRANYYLDRGDFSALAKENARIESLLDYVGEESRLSLRAELLFSALFCGDKQAVVRHGEILETLKNAKTALACRVCAAYELYEKEDLSAARVLLSRYQETLEKGSVPGIREMERDLARSMFSCLSEKEKKD